MIYAFNPFWHYYFSLFINYFLLFKYKNQHVLIFFIFFLPTLLT